MWRVGVDVGGTFTDLYAVQTGTGEERTAKVLTTSQDRVLGVLKAVEDAGLPLSGIATFVHGTTTGTNALIERAFPDAAMITTDGFRDVIEIGRMHREHLYRPYQTKPAPLIRRRNRFVVEEQVTSAGRVERPIDPSELAPIVDQIRRRNIQSVAVCFINSYVNSANERAVGEHLARELPAVAVSLSSEVKPVFREHARFSTTVVRTVLLPVMRVYFERLQETLSAGGFAGSLMILKSNGGMMSVEQAKTRAEELVESGPAGGIGYAAEIARSTGHRNIIHTDVGGTSFDTSIVEDGQGLITREYEIEFDIPVAVPMLDIRSVGAGGGSVAWIDEGGSLRVGPMSAGSDPGPACYGRGGTRPTVTDANLLLGRLSGDLSGKFALNVAAARQAMRPLVDRLGLTVEDCAEGIVRIATETMAQAVKIVLASRGRDPRDYALASFGGAGPMHACAVAAALQTPSVIVPRFSGVASAHGALHLKLKHDEEVFHFAALAPEALDGIAERFATLEARAIDALTGQGAEPGQVTLSRTLRMRYAGQTFEVDTGISDDVLADRDAEATSEAFHRAHKREFGVRSDDFGIEVVAIAVTAEAAASGPPDIAEASPGQQVKGGKTSACQIYFDGSWEVSSRYASDMLKDGAEVSGPAIIEDPHSCVIVPPGWLARTDLHRNIVLEERR